MYRPYIAYDNEINSNDVLLQPMRDMNLKLDSVDLSSIVEVEENGVDEDAFSSFWQQYCNDSEIPTSSQLASVMKKQNVREGAELMTPALPPLPATATTSTTLPVDAANATHRHLTEGVSHGPVPSPKTDELLMHGLVSIDNLASDNDASAIENALNEIMPDPLPTVQFATTRHPGNNRFYLLLQMYRKAFLRATDQGKSAVCDQIALKIRDIIYKRCVPNGRFLELNLQNLNRTTYKVLSPNKEVVDIIKWALREPPQPELARYFHKSAFISRNNDIPLIPDKKNEKILNSVAACNMNDSKSNTSTRMIKTSLPAATSARSVSDYRSSEYRSSEDSSFQSDYSHNSLNSSNFKWKDRNKKPRRPRMKKGVTFKNQELVGPSLKRRGTIISNGKAKKDFNLADRRYNIDPKLSNLVEGVFAKTPITASTCNSETTASISKSTVNKLGTQIGQFNIQDSIDENQTNTSLLENDEVIPTSVITQDGRTRSITQYDIFCEGSFSLHREKNIGNCRLRTMLQMNKSTFHSKKTTREEKERICDVIIHNIMKIEGKNGSFLHESNGSWVELEVKEVQKMVDQLMQKCPNDPNLQLPSVEEAFSKSLSFAEKSYQKLHSEALSSMKKKKMDQRRRKKKSHELDPTYVHRLQSAMLEKRQKTWL